MGRRTHKRSTEQEENNVGCVWGLMRMLYFRRDPKFLLDSKQVSRRHTFREIADGKHSAKKSGDFDEIDEDDNKEECTSQKQTVKRLMEDELGKVNLLKKIPDNEVQRGLPDLGYVSLDGGSEHTDKPLAALNQHTDIFASYLSRSMYSQGSKSLSHSEEYDLESDLANFLGEIYRYHGECPHVDCKNKSELCPSLKSLIHSKLNDLNNPHSALGYEQSQESKREGLLGDNSLSNNRAAQFKEFKDALEILSSNKELFLKLLQKPNAHILDNIQKHQNSRLTTKLEPDKSLGRPSIIEETRGSNHELTTQAQSKETKHVFFWRKDKSDRKHKPERTSRPQPVSKIVILKPNQGRRIDETETTSSRYLHQQPCTSQAPEFSGRESSKFSIKEVKRRFKIVTGESKRERNAIPADNLPGDSHWLKDSVIAVKDPRHLTEGILSDKAASNFKNGIKHSTRSKQKQQNDSQSEISDHIVAPIGESIFYEEAKKHLADMLKSNSQSDNHPTAQISKSLEGMLSLPHYNVSSPRSDHRGKCHTALSPEEAEVCFVSAVDVEELTHERSQSQDDSESNAYCTSAAVGDQVALLEECYMKEDAQEGTIYAPDKVDTMPVEGVGKLDCSKTVCNIQCIPAEQYTDSPLPELLEGKKPVQMFMSSPESMIEKMEQQDPKTPEPRSPKLPDGCPVQSNEKKEQPSPVSVLDSFDEDDNSPECKTVKEYELHEDFHGTLHFPDDESGVKVFWEDKNARLDYIMLVLELSELCAEQNLEVWYLEDELISPCMFEELQNQGDQIDDMKFLFDCICEALTQIQERYFRLSSWLSFVKHDIRTPPVGENLISEVDKYVDGYLKCSFPSTLEQIIKRDLEVQAWMDIRSKTEEIVVEIWEFVLDELIDEAVFDLWI